MKLRVLATALIAGSVLFSGLAKADKLDDIKQAGVVTVFHYLAPKKSI